MDAFEVSYAPSASVHHLCATKPRRDVSSSLVLGVPDPATPFIEAEARTVAAMLPDARLFVGAEANEEVLRAHGPHSRFVHLATHGLFRYDNPMFSSLQLGASRLSLFDIYQLDLGAELVTLSGCGTGLNVVEGGDELMGPGDVIIIPPIQNSIYVFGQVLRPGHVTFIEGKDFNYYVNEASGLGELAEEDEIMVIKGGSRAWISPIREKVIIEEGDYIYVPKESLGTLRSYILEYSVYLSLLASIAAILLSIVTISNN